MWWSVQSLKMSKARASQHPQLEDDDDVGQEVSSDHEAEAGEAEAEEPADALSALKQIGSILKNGFTGMENQMTTLRKSVKNVNSNIVNLSSNMDGAFKDLHETLEEGNSESEDEEVRSDQASVNGRVDNGDAGHAASLCGDGLSANLPATGGASADQDSVLDSRSKELEIDNSVGPPLLDPVAAFISKAFSKTPKVEEIKKKKALYPRPANVECLATPRINEPIFLKLPSTFKNRDRVWQENHGTFLSVVTAFSRVADLLRANEIGGAPWIREALSISADAFTMCASLNADWGKARREDIKPALPDDFKRLASNDVPASKSQLFGDDLEASIKAVEIHNRLSKKMDTTVAKPKPPANKFDNSDRRNRSRKRKKFFKKRPLRDEDSDGEQDRRRGKRKDFRKKGNSR